MIEPITTAVQEITIDSNRILHHTEADLIDRRIPNVIRLVQYDDTLPVIAVDLKSGGVTYALPEGAACNIRIKKPDNTIVYNPALGCDASRSVVYFEVTPQVGVVVGELQTVLEVILNAKTAGTSPLRIVVETNPIKVDDYESMDEVQTIVQLVGEAEEARDEAVAAAETAAHDAVVEVADDIFKPLATYEATTIASRAYAIGDYLVYNNTLYRITSAIEQGDTIVPDMNVVKTTVTNALTTKAEQDGAYPDLTAGQMLSKVESADSVPYNFRAVGHDATLEYTDAIVGGSVVKNQLVNSGMTSVTVPNGHKYLSIISSVVSIGTSTGTGISINDATKDNIFDLTQMFGTTIANYVNTIETATSGAGVAWLRKHFPKLFTYQEYNAGEIVSVQGLSQHMTVGFNQWDEEWEVGGIDSSSGQNDSSRNGIRTKNYISVMPNTTYYCYVCGLTSSSCKTRWYDANKNYIGYSPAAYYGKTFATPSNAHYLRFCQQDTYGKTYNHDICINLSDPTRNGTYEPYVKHTYPLDSDLTLRGILKFDTNNNLYADGDRYLPDGTVQRRYGVVDLGNGNWTKSGNDYIMSASSFAQDMLPKAVSISEKLNAICSKLKVTSQTKFEQENNSISYYSSASNGSLIAYSTDSYADANAFKQAMSGVLLVYELATPTTESADPYTVPQIIDPNGTEEYVSTSIVPVGHESRYPDDLRAKLDGLPWDLSMIAPIENGTTASQAYKVGKLLIHNGYLYRVTTAIASGGTITPGTNCVQTTVGEEVENKVLRFDSVAVSATTGDIATVSDSRITADHVVVECVWGNSSYITTDVTATTAAGSLTLNGTATAATTATVTLVKKDN